MQPIIIAILGSGALSAIIAGVFNLINNHSSIKSNESKLLMGLAYKAIVELSQKYINRGYISVEEYKELEHYFAKPYMARGGNGTAAKLVKEVSQLPTEKENK